MAKHNTKAGAAQFRQDMAAVAKAEEAAQEQVTEEQEQGVVEDEVVEEVIPVQEGVFEKDIIVAPIAVTPPPAPVVEKVVVAEAAKPVAANVGAVERLATILKNVPAANQVEIKRIQTYLERMAPNRPIDAKTICAEQVALYRSIQNIINRQEEYFTQLFSALLYLFNVEGKTGALSDRYRMRGMDNIALHVGDRKAFANITQMLHILADAKSRDLAMGQINMEKALENGLTADGKKRVLSYFGV